jgi:hypothetical protein
MSLFQQVILKKQLQTLDHALISQAYQKFTAYFHQPTIQTNIRAAKEEQFQEGFLRELFVNVLGYTINPEAHYNLTTEYKNQKGAKKADGAVLDNHKQVKAVIELKGTKVTDLDNIEIQAFGYKNNQSHCRYVITSNFEKLRFYIDNAIDFMEWNLFTLTENDFNILYLLLHKNSLLSDLPATLKASSLVEEENITKKLYAEYSSFRKELFQNLVSSNPQIDKLILFKKTQKLLDRFLFLFFAEDKLLIPANSVRSILNQWNALKNDPLTPIQPLYSRFKNYFYYLNFGFKSPTHEIFAYNGGLFSPDDIIDNLIIDDDILYRSCATLSDYDYDSEIDVNILGHIFEHSLSEIEELEATIATPDANRVTKRKKDGIFYTPRYITKYIVENTIGALCIEEKKKLEINEEEYFFRLVPHIKKKTKTKAEADNIIIVKGLLDKLNAYKSWLLQLTIVDPACGSGAFLNQALEFLIAEHRWVAELERKLTGSSLVFDVENSILENNLFGVDINEESVEIAKLSLWLRTAMPNRKLTSLSHHIKCGNSLIDDASVAGDKAFDWQKEFPLVFAKGGFDVVIGNPPYGAKLSEVEKKRLLHKYASCERNQEIYAAFFELSINLIKEYGLLGFITPVSWQTGDNYFFLRNFFKRRADISIAIKLPYNTFSDAYVDTGIYILKNKINAAAYMSLVYEYPVNFKELYDIKNTSKLHQLYSDNWENSASLNFVTNPYFYSLDAKVRQDVVLLGDISSSIRGILAATEDFFHSESEGLKKVFVGDAYRYEIREAYSWVKYGENLKEKPNSPEWFCGDRILVRRLISRKFRLLATFMQDDFVNKKDIYVVKAMDSKYSLKYLLAIINSRLMSFLKTKGSSSAAKDDFSQLTLSDIRALPIKYTENQRDIILLVDVILASNKNLQTLSTKFTTYFAQQYHLEKLSTKLVNWHTLDFSTFILELNKAIKTVKGKLLTRKDEFNWIDLFEENKQKAQALSAQITQTDNEIDQRVYQLYGLTPEEIAIVEGK